MASCRAVLLTPLAPSHPAQLLSRQHVAHLSPLAATLTRPPSKCCKQRACTIPKSFSCDTYEKQGVGPSPFGDWPSSLLSGHQLIAHERQLLPVRRPRRH